MEKVNVPYRNSRLFSRDFLAERLPRLTEWQLSSDRLREIQTQLRDLFAQALPATSEAGLEEELIRPILSEILGFSYLVQPSRRIFKTHRQPDYALFPDEETKQAAKALDGEKKLFEHAHAVADAKAWDVDLDAVGPASQMHDYILLSGVRWGVITNGRRWRLYHRDTVPELDVFYEVDLEELITAEDPETLKYFLLFFRAESFAEGGFLDQALTESVKYSQQVGTELKENVFEALRLLCQGFLDGNGSLGPDDLPEIHENGLILLYRILFLLYAESEEEKELLPLSNPTYRDRISLYAIKRDAANRDDWLAESHTLWSRLKDLFGFIHRGSEELGIYEYNGGLFDPTRYPFLEQYQLGDRYLAEALRLLTCTEEDGRRGFLDYATLDVRELGSIYEGLLEHRLILQDGTLSWEKDPSERKKTGSYYTPEYIVSYIVENTIGPLVDEIEQKLREELASLNKEIRGARGENRRLLQEKRNKLLAGARERVLNLKILDPAMGSGHFLVSACDYLARRIAGLEAALTGKEMEEAVTDLKRTVAVRSLYGVDLNPLATELAKLSLWLHTVAKGKPLSFLDHHLRTGNSLIGATVNDLKRPPSGKSFEIGLWESKLVEDLGKAIRHLAFIKESVSDSRSDIEAKKEEWALVNAWIGKYKQAADVWLSPYFGNKLTDKDYSQVIEAAAENKIDKVANRSFFVRAQEIAARVRFFHWELEFPDVFFDRFGRSLDNPGFDAVIGNPPWLGVRTGKIEPKLLSYLRRRFKSSIGQFDLAATFLELGCLLATEQGLIGEVVPKRIATNESYKELRKSIAIVRSLRLVIDLGVAFEGVNNDVLILVSGNGKASPTATILGRMDSYLRVHFYHVYSSIISSMPFYIIPVNSDISAVQLTVKITKGNIVPLGDIADITRGAECGMNHPAISHSKTPASLPMIDHLDMRRYYVAHRGWFIDPLRIESTALKPVSIYRTVPKLLVRFLSSTLVVAKDDVGYASTNLVYHITSEYNVNFLCGILCSQLLDLWYRTAFQNEEVKFPHVQKSHLKQLPIRRIAFTTPEAERARLVEEGKRLYFEALERLGLKDENDG